MNSTKDAPLINRTPVFAPFRRKAKERTGGLYPLASIGRIRVLRNPRESPVKEQRVPGFGKRTNSGMWGLIGHGGGIATGVVAIMGTDSFFVFIAQN